MPLERTLLANGIMLAGLESRRKGGTWIDTPELVVVLLLAATLTDFRANTRSSMCRTFRFPGIASKAIVHADRK